MQPRRVLVLLAATAAAGILAGCGASAHQASTANSLSTAVQPSSSTSTSPAQSGITSGQPATAATITIKTYSYTVPHLVKAGSTVMVKNSDSVTHTVTADSGHAFDITIQAGATAHFTAPSKPGSYKFHCTFHPYMQGTLTVD